MEADFWHQKWQNNEIGFHQSQVNPFLQTHFAEMKSLTSSSQGLVFVPLCGKSLDMVWLHEQHFQVVGIELNQSAVEAFFQQINLTPAIEQLGDLICYKAANYELYVGDIFALSPEQVGLVDWIYDRAALVALPQTMRQRYTQHLTHLTSNAPQLLITFSYPQHAMDGPPFSIPKEELISHYGQSHSITLLEQCAIDEDDKLGKVGAIEQVWQLAHL